MGNSTRCHSHRLLFSISSSSLPQYQTRFRTLSHSHTSRLRPCFHSPEHHPIWLHSLTQILQRPSLRCHSRPFQPSNFSSFQRSVLAALLLPPAAKSIPLRPRGTHQELLQAPTQPDPYTVEWRHSKLLPGREPLWLSPFLLGREISLPRWKSDGWHHTWGVAAQQQWNGRCVWR